MPPLVVCPSGPSVLSVLSVLSVVVASVVSGASVVPSVDSVLVELLEELSSTSCGLGDLGDTKKVQVPHRNGEGIKGRTKFKGFTNYQHEKKDFGFEGSMRCQGV